MSIKSINPATEEVLMEFDDYSDEKVDGIINKSNIVYSVWKSMSFYDRSILFKRLAENLCEEKNELAKLASLEMGKVFSQGVAEVEKCASVCNFYADNAEKFLADEHIEVEGRESFIAFDPIGVVLAVMPWNFPFWQVIRCASAAMMAGNTVLLKHASNVPQCALAIERLFVKSGFPENAFSTLLIGASKVERVIRNDAIVFVSLTGSEAAGSSVASIAGAEIKRTVLELGGNDPFIVLSDANVQEAARVGALARLNNNGQTCIAAKRFIVIKDIYDDFIKAFKAEFESFKLGDPLNDGVGIGPLVNEQGLHEIERQVKESLSQGAELITGGKRVGDKGFYYQATILSNITEDMTVFKEEVFGVVAPVIVAENVDDAIRIANNSKFGLGASLWTEDTHNAKILARKIDSGSVCINNMVRSNVYLPFGGVKKSGYGRELSHYGIKEFTNIKNISVF